MIYSKIQLNKEWLITVCISAIILFSGHNNIYAQPANDDCSQAQLLCAGDTIRGNTGGATADFESECIGTNPTVWYKFKTSDNKLGSITVDITRDSTCNIPGSTGDGLKGVVLRAGPGSIDPCIDSSFLELLQSCDSAEFNTSLKLGTELNTDYWVQVSGIVNDQGMVSSCGFDISISGTAVTVYAGPDKTIFKGASDTLNGEGPDFGTFNWDPFGSLTDDHTLSPIASPEETTSYTLTGDIGECKNLTDVVRVVVKDEGVDPRNLIVPSLNSSKDLSTWKIVDIENFPNAVIEVYNRWGQRVFVSVGYDNSNGWDGSFNGETLPEGTYYYVIQLNRSELQVENVQTGFVAIVR